MTVPSGADPSGYQIAGVDGTLFGGGFASLASRTEANVRATKQTQVGGNDIVSGVLGALYNGLQDGVSYAIAIIGGIVNTLIGGPATLFSTLGQALTTLATFATNIIRGATTAINQIGDILNGLIVVPISGAVATFQSWFASLLGFQSSTTATLTVHTEAISNLNDIAAAQNTTVAYVGDLQDMVTVPRSQLVTMGELNTKSQNVLTFVPNDRDMLPVMPIILPQFVSGGSGGGHIYYAPIVVDRHGTVDKIRWIAGADSSIFSINYYEVALCVYNPVTGNIEKVFGSGNIKDTFASTTTLAEVQIAMAIDQGVVPGQILFFAHQQTAPGLFQNTRGFASVPQGGVARPSALLLNSACFVAPNYSQGIPSSISLASLTPENRFIPWGAVSVLAPPPVVP